MINFKTRAVRLAAGLVCTLTLGVGVLAAAAPAQARPAITPAAAIAADSYNGSQVPAAVAAQKPHVVRWQVVRPTATGARTATASACGTPITRGTHTGAYLCGTGYLNIWWNDGREETVVVGTDNAVWHVYQRYAGDPTWAGWFSFGGVALNGVYPVDLDPTFAVLGDDGNYWCKRWGSGGWSGFFKSGCNPVVIAAADAASGSGGTEPDPVSAR